MSHPNTPQPHDPYGQQPGQEASGGYPPQLPGYPQQGGATGGQSAPYGAQQPGGYPPPPGTPQTGGYQAHNAYEQPQQPGGYPPPTGGQPGHHGQYGGYAPGGPGGYGDSSAVTGQPNQEERTMGLITHLGGAFASWIVPLVIYLIKKDESPYNRDQAAQALNFQLLMLIGYFVSGILMIVLIGYLTWFALWITSLVVSIMGATAANRGEWYRYPFNVSWIK